MKPAIDRDMLRENGSNRHLSQYVGTAKLASGRSIVWSGLTGFVGIVPSDLAVRLGHGADPADEDLRILEQEGLFYSGSEDNALVDILEKLAKGGSKPTHYRVVLTGSCDLTCSYCIQAKIRRLMSPRLDPKVLDDIVRYVETNSLPGPIEILLMGGEPLYDVQVAVDTIKSIFERFSNSGKNRPYFKLLTNGLNLSDFVKEIGEGAGLVRDIQVSVDQGKEIHDSVKKDRFGSPTFDRVISGVKHAAEAGIQVTLRMNIHKPELDDKFLQTCDQLYNEIGSDRLTIYPALVIQRPFAKNKTSSKNYEAGAEFSRLLNRFFLWHHAKTGQIHPRHIPQPRWINCAPKLGPPSMLGSSGEVYSCTYSMPASPNIDVQLQRSEEFPLSRDRCEVLAQEIWNETCRKCKFVAFCTGTCSVKTAAGQTFTADCQSWPERFRTYGEIVESMS